MTSKAIRATIKLGSIEIDGYQMPDGKYFLSLVQVAETIEMPLKRMSQLRELELSLTLYPQGFQESELQKVEGGTKPVKSISLDDATKYWTLAASRQNMRAFMLVAACTAEALERRFDSAFGVVRTEQERQDKLEARIDHADGWRKNFTSWQKRDGCEVGQDYAIRVKELKSAARLPVEISIKDYTSKEVKIMTNAEVIYDAMRRKGLNHEEALESL